MDTTEASGRRLPSPFCLSINTGRKQSYLIVGGFDHKTGQDTDTQKCMDNLEQFVRDRFNVSRVAAKWSSQYFEPADGLPYIGHLPGHGKNVFVARGFGGNGMTYSHVTALVIHALLDNKKAKPYDKLFSPGRIKPVAGFKNFISQGIETAANLVQRLIPAKKAGGKSAPSLQKGEGKILSYEGQKAALYKSDKGNISAVKPV